MSEIEYGPLKINSVGISALVEDWPGRLKYYIAGFAISGAADHYAHRMANTLVGNPVTEATLEITGGMFEAEFTFDTVIALTGADAGPTINDEPIPMWEAIKVKKGDVLKLGFIQKGFRTYLAFAGGIDVPVFLDSKSTCVWGAYGGFNGRSLRSGDILKIGKLPSKQLDDLVGRHINSKYIPEYDKTAEVRMVPGPTASPEYVTERGYDLIYSTEFKLDYQCDRSGYRLKTPEEIFPKEWARNSGGEAGLHPSNIVDMGYPIPGGLNVTGDMIIILGPDGPCGGGYVIIGKVIYADVWKVFQLPPGRGSIKFQYVSLEEAEELRRKQDEIFEKGDVIKG